MKNEKWFVIGFITASTLIMAILGKPAALLVLGGRFKRTDPSADPLNDPSREQKQEDRWRGLQAPDDPHRFRCMRGTAHRILRNQSSSGNLKDVRLIMY